MRRLVKAKDLKPGQTAYLPYCGALRRAYVTEVHRSNEGINPPFMRVQYKVEGPYKNVCFIRDIEREYEVYVRPAYACQHKDHHV